MIETINLFVEEHDPISIHTLIGASFNILHDHLDIDDVLDLNLILHCESIYVRDEYRKEWITRIRDASNFFKHADFDLKKGRNEIKFETELNVFHRLRFISLRRGISPWIPPPMKSPSSFAVSCRINNRTVNSISSCGSKSKCN